MISFSSFPRSLFVSRCFSHDLSLSLSVCLCLCLIFLALSYNAHIVDDCFWCCDGGNSQEMNTQEAALSLTNALIVATASERERAVRNRFSFLFVVWRLLFVVCCLLMCLHPFSCQFTHHMTWCFTLHSACCTQLNCASTSSPTSFEAMLTSITRWELRASW